MIMGKVEKKMSVHILQIQKGFIILIFLCWKWGDSVTEERDQVLW